jgi:hypothetical protein
LTPSPVQFKGVFKSFDFCPLLDQIRFIFIYLVFCGGGGEFRLFICCRDFKKMAVNSALIVHFKEYGKQWAALYEI